MPGAPGRLGRPAKILVIDNYDSFVYNLVQYLAQLAPRSSSSVTTRSARQTSAPTPTRTVSTACSSRPVPARPRTPGSAWLQCEASIASGRPLFGVCLGHQAIGAVFGGTVSRAAELLHGKTSAVEHEGVGVLAGVPSPFTATRYHSLAVEEGTLPVEVEVTGRTASGVVMALRHRDLPIEGVQFHPESVLTQGGHLMLANWLRGLGHDVDDVQVTALAAGVETLRGQAFTAAAV